MEKMTVTVTEAATMTSLGPRMIRRALANGDQTLPHTVARGKIMIAVDDLRAWASTQE